MRTVGILMCGAALAVLPALAQDTPPPPPAGQMQGPPPGGGGGRGGMNPERQLAMLKEQLNLTPDQAEKIKGILDEGRGKMEELRADTTTAPDDKRSKMMEIRKHENEKIKAVLTPDQVTKFDAMASQQRGRMRGQGGDGGGTPPPPPPPQ
jgi:periplasmic protein CpxP/Spy